MDRPADGKTVLLSVGRRLDPGKSSSGKNVRKRIARIETLISKVRESAAVDVIAPGLGNDVDNTAARTAEFGVVIGTIDLEFLNGFLTQRRADAATLIVCLRTVYRDAVTAAVAAVE